MTTIIARKPNREDYKTAASLLRSGGLVAFPTETVYGLGGNGLDASAAMKIYKAKGRPSDNPLILHLYDPKDAEKYCVTCPLYYRLAMAFMPGPLTVILPKKDGVPPTVTGGLDTVAVRVPSHPVARRLLRAFGLPIAAPSANVSGKPSPTTADHVIDDMNGRIDMILDGGPCEIGVESTIVSISGESGEEVLHLLRPGGITPDMLAPFCAELILDPCLTRMLGENERPLAPGMKYKHYAPNADVVLLDGENAAIREYMRARSALSDVGLMYPEEWNEFSCMNRAVCLGSGIGEAAKNLFACLRAFDKMPEIRTVYAPLPSKEGIGLAVYNRLAKAAGFSVRRV